jgi:broad specificity phosphatase PhoE
MLAAMGQEQSLVQTLPGLNEYPAEALYASYTQGRDALAHQRADARDYWRTFRQAMLAWADDTLEAVPERWSDFGLRVREAVDMACGDTRRDDVVLVVSSGGAIGRLVADTVGAPAATAIDFNLQFRNTGLCELISASAGLRLLTYNTIPHLERADRRHAITFA